MDRKAVDASHQPTSNAMRQNRFVKRGEHGVPLDDLGVMFSRQGVRPTVNSVRDCRGRSAAA